MFMLKTLWDHIGNGNIIDKHSPHYQLLMAFPNERRGQVKSQGKEKKLLIVISGNIPIKVQLDWHQKSFSDLPSTVKCTRWDLNLKSYLKFLSRVREIPTLE